MTTVPGTQIYLDEDMPVEIATLLRNAGFMVYLPQDIGTRAEQDPVHLQISTDRGWVLITRNRKDFWRLHWIWMSLHYWGLIPRPHSGILTVHEQGRDLREPWAAAIVRFLQVRPRFPGQMYLWRPGQPGSPGRWETQAVKFA